jgi:DNA polymerase
MPSDAIELSTAYLAQEAELYGREIVFELRENCSARPPRGDSTLTAPGQTDSPVAPEADSLPAFHDKIKDCVKCALGHTRRNFVFGSGNPSATLMFIGEAPGQEEDEQGLPFVGAAGQLLTKIIGVAGFARDEVYIANILKCRPPGNRTPLPDEIESCLPYLHRQIELIKPRYIFCLGRTAALGLLGLTETLGNMRKKTYQFQQSQVFVTYHPSALLRNPQWRWDCFEDLKKFRAVYDAEVGDKPPMQNLEAKKRS